MTEQSPSAIGTVAQEAARLIEDMAAMARSAQTRSEDPGPYAGEPAAEPVSPEAPQAAGRAGDAEAGNAEAGNAEAKGHPSTGACSQCGAQRDDTPETCKLCPLCRGISLFRSVRPETVDLLADLAQSVAAGLRDVAMRSRASDPPSSATPAPGGPPEGDRATVQDIPVDDESEG
jgi:hypothetical protein